MNLETFASITRNVIRENGFEDFQPTVCLPERKDVRSFAGVPGDEELEPIVLRWAAEIARPGEEYLVAFKYTSTEFKVVRFERGMSESQVYVAED